MLKHKILVLLLIITLISPAIAEPENIQGPLTGVSQETPLEPINAAEESPNTVQELPPAPESIQYKQPVSKRKIAKKFLLAMAGVGISSILLFALLSLYNKIRGGVSNQQTTPEGETSLVTPYSLEEAVRTFLDKTKY